MNGLQRLIERDLGRLHAARVQYPALSVEDIVDIDLILLSPEFVYVLTGDATIGETLSYDTHRVIRSDAFREWCEEVFAPHQIRVGQLSTTDAR